ncbi:protein SPA1-RELATED 2 [Euphorbia lathyris]|uniref:protein SPA1-RELATED 2 n=1 Tax=Euphorbia lathyris TaxID=212925 RepID=UPI00331445C4
MDQGLGDEMAPLDVPEGGHLHNKENEYPLKPPESSNLLEYRQIVMPKEGEYAGGSFHVITDLLDAKDVTGNVNSVDASEHLRNGPHCMDDYGNIVEELTVQNYDSSNLPIVGTSNNRERLQTRESQRLHGYQLGAASGIGIGSSCNTALNRDNDPGISSVRENLNGAPSPAFLGHKAASCSRNEAMEQSTDAENKAVPPNMFTHSGIRTKMLSKSGFAEFFVKNTLNGKGITFRAPPDKPVKIMPNDANTGKAASVTLAASNSSPKIGMPSSAGTPGLKPTSSNHDGVSLRQWLNARKRKMKKVESLYIFRQIVDLVDYSHSQGLVLRDLRPSCFRLLISNQVKYIGCTVQRDTPGNAADQDNSCLENNMVRRQPAEQGTLPFVGSYAKKQKLSENNTSSRQWPQLTAKYTFKCETANDGDINLAGTRGSVNKFTAVEDYSNAEYGIQGKSSHLLSKTAQQQLTSVNVGLEDKWYASPEELNEGICTISSNTYSLGVLLFELLGHFDAGRGLDMAMSDLRHRILPAQFLSESPKEAGFCLWLLHPVPSSRPTTREILQCEVLSGLQKVSTEELSSSIDHDDAESELLFHFLITLNEHKQKYAAKLESDLRCIEADIEEVEKRYRSKNTSETQLSQISNSKEVRLKSNFSQLESAYFSIRSKIPEMNATQFQDKDLLRARENYYSALVGEGKQNPTDRLGSFFEGLCKYARYSKFEVRGLLRTGDFNNSANVICSLSFNRDLDYFSTAGVSKKVKIFEFNPLLDDSFDIHHPVIELPNKSKLSCVCWNNYIKNYLASTDYDGVVKLWDANTGQDVFQYSEHERRAWSVDFSRVYPTKLASGSDDCTVKLWSINEKKSLGTIRNIANVCCVQFSSYSTHLLAFGSADYRTYCYDMRNVRAPWCVLAGHDKAVSYVKFLDPETLVTASTDNSLRLWDLTKASASGLSTNACSLTLSGHTNEKNFVGLSVSDGYISCGSETNEVYAYHRSLPMPITSHKFGSIDPISGKQTDDDGGQFVSSVCWRGNSDMVLAANSTGCIKVLQMV